jgi:hypothetical protein
MCIFINTFFARNTDSGGSKFSFTEQTSQNMDMNSLIPALFNFVHGGVPGAKSKEKNYGTIIHALCHPPPLVRDTFVNYIFYNVYIIM